MFKIGDLFTGIKQGSRLTKDSQIEGELPFVMSGVTNTGISNYISNDVEIFPSNSITVDIFGNTFYRDYRFGMGDDTGALWDRNNFYTKNQMIYIASVIQKRLEGIFSYGNKLRSSQISPYEIYLPVDQNKNPDLDFMEKFIKIQQKIAIEDVIEWRDKQIVI